MNGGNVRGGEIVVSLTDYPLRYSLSKGNKKYLGKEMEEESFGLINHAFLSDLLGWLFESMSAHTIMVRVLK